VILNALIFLYFLGIAPKLVWDWIFKGKKHPGLSQRLGFSIPDHQGKPVIWIHAVSVGEVKSAQPLFLLLRKKYPNHFFLITTTSATGHLEARRSLKEADAFAYLPIDLTWVVQRWVKKLKPALLILVESDFWPHLLASVKKQGGRVALVSGKLSERSAGRYHRFSNFSKRLFSSFDLICLQNQDYADRFKPLLSDPSRIHVTGNLKMDLQPQEVDHSFWETKLALPKGPIFTISCTHPGEEELLLDALYRPDWFFFLVPRHPERFQEVAHLLAHKQIPFVRWSQLEQKTKDTKVILVDAMGQLPICYAFSRLAIVGGSYVPHIGGHNVLEPCLYSTPPFFGPYMFGQAEFAARVSTAQAGKQISLEDLHSTVELFLSDPDQEKNMKAAASQLIESGRGAAARTLTHLESLIP